MNRPIPESTKSFEACLAELYGRINYERQLPATARQYKLRNMREILSRLEDPHLRYPVIHVAGTKGKGSVCTMVGQILTQSGRRTGVYTSPHLEKINQRIAINGELISDEQFVNVLSALAPAIKEMDAEAEQQNCRPLTFFEVTTAAAFYFFAEQKCDAVVLEVGLGGRMDSTNTCEPIATVITNISMDHTRQLGSTVDKIAYEKAGIIKPGVPVISGATEPAAAAVIAEVASKNDAPLVLFETDFHIPPLHDTDNAFACQGRWILPVQPDVQRSTSPTTGVPNHGSVDFQIDNLKLKLLGHHQRINAALAVATIQSLNAQGWDVSNDTIREGLQRATLCGRTELVGHRPTVIIDMAHNTASINALIDTLWAQLPNWKSSSRRTLIFATSRDKDAPGMLRPLIGNFDEIVLTKYRENPRGKNEDELLDVAKSIQTELRSAGRPAANLVTEKNPGDAWDRVRREFQPDHIACISGSAFLVAELRKTILSCVNSQDLMIDA